MDRHAIMQGLILLVLIITSIFAWLNFLRQRDMVALEERLHTMYEQRLSTLEAQVQRLLLTPRPDTRPTWQ